ncbi:tryptophan-rich sensory protein [Sporosarcina sp. Sa2YVA2]|uniref:Tryptophan-rich sensory protein n=2 Tax=Sporosarcina quadrami TaxID=2762234 RepID=A0ABR8U7H4_9BACL|nr:tryptophan-rich sensory protein [Sporosarcina quadrami]
MVVTYLLMITMNALANLLPLNGQNTGEISDKYANLFAPAGFTFSIWSVIYVLLALHILYQLGLFRNNNSNTHLLTQISIYFSLSSVLNTLWIIAWHYDQLLLSVFIMIGMLLTLIHINKLTAASTLSLKENFFIKLPFSIYFGWITVATIANITALLVSIGWNGFGLSEATWTIIILIIGTVIGVLTMLRLNNAAYGLAILWAYFGIYSKHTSVSGFNYEYPAIIQTVIICMAVIASTMIFVLLRKSRK